MTEQVEILRIASGGDGVGRMADGKVVFVPRTAPGDTVTVEIVEVRKRFARGFPLAILSAGAARQEPRCRHYTADSCGACQLQHIGYEAQLLAKGAIVGDALRRLGGIDVPDPVVEPAPHRWGYRAKITLAVGRDQETGTVGFRSYRDPDRVFDLESCAVATDAVREAWSALAAARHALPSDLTQVVIREAGDTIQVVLSSAARTVDSTALVEGMSRPCSLWLRRPDGSLAPVTTDGSGTGTPPLVFEQTNPELADRIRRTAVSSLGDCSGQVVADLFCGLGMTARLLVDAGALVRAVDSDVAAIEWATSRVPTAMFIAARVEDCLAQLGEPAAVIVNPPRTGLPARVRQWLRDRRERVSRLVYISCDPATLARDVKEMGYGSVAQLGAYDLFPQTSHVETMAVLQP